ncbi:hypothetical protein CASFOL_038761 [Castilleja foliolosa]|uniref:GRIP domain-containing protein n=1 Tax=Castilleja foliolosa TaxID=1961234 RepID=A0ABD3BIR9_9LAMI
MSEEGGEVSGVPENPVEYVMNKENEQHNLNTVADRSPVEENGYHDVKTQSNYIHDELVHMVVELSFQNEYMKSQFDGLKNHILDSHDSDWPDKQKVHSFDDLGCGDVREMRGEIDSLKKELVEERQTRGAAEEALMHLRAAHLEADVKAQEFSAKLAEAQQKMDHEIQERDEKYSELDTKFNRLHKRAKQRIQEIQKEKEDIEAQFLEVNGKADLASSQLSALQQELERTRQHANEALKAMDTERQQLRNTNNKYNLQKASPEEFPFAYVLRDNIEELRHSLIPKENALEAMQQSILEKVQMLEDMQGLLQVADEKQQDSIAELSLKHQKQVEDMEAQIADVLAERNRATETISSLRAIIAEKDTKIAEMDAASSGEAARLRAAMETLKGELSHLRNEYEKEKESLEAALQSMISKLENSEGNRVHAEVEAARLRSQLESELSVQTRLLNSKDVELGEAIEKINRIENEFASYKVRAHALLQKKDADLAAARDNDQFRALEEALKDAEREVLLISAEKDKAFQDLKEALTDSEKEISLRDAAISMAEQQIKNMQLKFESTLSMHQSEKEIWDKRLQNVEEACRLRCETLEKKNAEFSTQDLKKEVEELKLHCKMLKEEQNTFRDLADKMMEEKDKEISRLLDDNRNLQQLLDSRPSAEYYDDYSALQKQEASNSSTSAAEQQILILARQQAQREEELAQTQRHILALQEEIEELEHENRLHSQQEAMLKEELRNMERSQKREGVDLTYLKNVTLKLLETGEVERLLPVIAMLLQFSPDEMQKCQQAYHASSEVPPSPAGDSSGSGRSLFSRFSFT